MAQSSIVALKGALSRQRAPLQTLDLSQLPALPRAVPRRLGDLGWCPGLALPQRLHSTRSWSASPSAAFMQQVIMVEEIPRFKLYYNKKKKRERSKLPKFLSLWQGIRLPARNRVAGKVMREYAFQVTCGSLIRGSLAITACRTALESVDPVVPFRLVWGRESLYFPVSREAAKGVCQARLLGWFMMWLWINFNFYNFFSVKQW